MNNLDRADALLTAEELRTKYTNETHCGEHPQYLQFTWRVAVLSGRELNGYWQWVENQIEDGSL